MAVAHNNLYNTSLTEMPTTDLYIEFKPQSIEDIKALYATDAIFYDYPLEYEVKKMGDYYQELAADEFPILYAVVKPNFKLPNVEHRLIANLHLSQKNPRLNAEALRITGNFNDINDYIGFDLQDVSELDMGIIPEQIECTDPNCTPKLRLISGENEPPQWEWYCDCTPDPSPSQCTSTGDIRKPYGQVRVQDTELSNSSNSDTYLPVRKVKVILKDNWFSSFSTLTNYNGCFKFDRKFWGLVWGYVEFKNDRCSIRGAHNGFNWIWTYFNPIRKRFGVLHNHKYSNIIVNSHLPTSIGSETHLFWGAATIFNALNDFYDYANTEGINTPPNHLDIYAWLGNGNPEYSSSGFSTMSQQMGVSNTSIALTAGSFNTSNLLALPFIFFAATSIAGVLPDVMINIESLHSDKLKELSYHELTHASHYTVVDNSFWMTLITAEIKADNDDGGPHGNSSSWEAGRIALCESWAEHIGMTFADKTYPLPLQQSIGVLYIDRLERTWNEVPNHIPIGLYHDLIDGGTEPPSWNADWSASTTVNDNVSGFTNQMMFNCMNANVSSINDFRTQLINTQLSNTSNTQTNVNALFNSY